MNHQLQGSKQQIDKQQEIEINYINSSTSVTTRYEDFEDYQDRSNSQRSSIRYGKNIVFYFINEVPFFTIGPDWPNFLCLFSIFSLFGLGTTLIIMHLNQQQSIIIMTLVINIFQQLIFLYTALRNPGIVTKPENLSEDEIQSLKYKKFKKQKELYCDICRVELINNRVHCEDCDICVEEYDHHCPWTGKCIGKQNLVPFYVFLVSTCIFFVYNFMMIMVSARNKSQN